MYFRGTALLVASLFLLLSPAIPACAAASTGTIVGNNHYAWSDDGGWTNWSANGGNVTVTDTALTGYIWDANFGWINLSPSLGGVSNNGRGVLSGFAWGENTGWVDFSGVTIDGGGVLHGHTVAQSIFGIMTFDCANCNVTTSWRTSLAGGSNATSGGGGTVSGPLSVGYQNSTAAAASFPTSTPALPPTPPTLTPTRPPSRVQSTHKPPSSGAKPAPLIAGIPTSTTPQSQPVTSTPKAGTDSTGLTSSPAQSS